KLKQWHLDYYQD
ncbi:hypothetical protein CFSAN002075_16037, partial [Salmonella enterica subsp. enterica serovar Heidelberg str. CFSAN002075]